MGRGEGLIIISIKLDWKTLNWGKCIKKTIIYNCIKVQNTYNFEVINKYISGGLLINIFFSTY